jgi:hypothetical protein
VKVLGPSVPERKVSSDCQRPPAGSADSIADYSAFGLGLPGNGCRSVSTSHGSALYLGVVFVGHSG